MEYYVAWVRWKRESTVPSDKPRSKKARRVVESGEEIYPITVTTDEEAITEIQDYIKPSQGSRGEGSMERRIVKLWKVREIKIPK